MRHTKPLPLDEAERQTLTQMSLRHPALSREDVLLAATIAEEESLTLCGIADRMQSRTGHELGCALKTLGEALKKEGFSFKKTRLSLKKTGRRRVPSQARNPWPPQKRRPRRHLPADLF